MRSLVTTPATLSRRDVFRGMFGGLAGLMLMPSASVVLGGCGPGGRELVAPKLSDGRELTPGMLLVHGTALRMGERATDMLRRLMPNDYEQVRGVVITEDTTRQRPLQMQSRSANAPLTPGAQITFRIARGDMLVIAGTEAASGWNIRQLRASYGEDVVVSRRGNVISIWNVAPDMLLEPTDWILTYPAAASS